MHFHDSGTVIDQPTISVAVTGAVYHARVVSLRGAVFQTNDVRPNLIRKVTL